jgi:CIC family chloride channel protein
METTIVNYLYLRKKPERVMINRRKRWIIITYVYCRRALNWVRERITRRNYQILVSLLIGIVAGLAAVVLKYAVVLFRDWMYGNDPTSGKIGFVFFPIIGLGLTYLYLRYGLRHKIDFGFPSLIYKISKKKVDLPIHESYAHMISSSLTVGLGGSVGLEAPIVRTGSAIGSNMARLLRVGRQKQTLFLACGAAAGMAAIFNSPVAAVIFAFEVLLTDLALPAFIPLLIAAATGAVVSRFFYYEQLFYLPTDGWTPQDIPFFLLLGLICGFYSLYIIRALPTFERLFGRVKTIGWRFVLGGLALGTLIFLMPPLFGEGYETINLLLMGDYVAILDHTFLLPWADVPWTILGFGFLLLLAKAAATSLTLTLGGNGGIFAPSMFAGATLGFLFAAGLNQTGMVDLPTADFIAVAMAGILSGVIKSPLTGIFLIAEITGGYLLFVPLMIVSAISYFVAYYFEPQSIFTKELYQKGLWVPAHEKDRQVLKDLALVELVETNFAVLGPDQTLGDFVKVIAQSHRNLFPVTDEERNFLGVILLDDVREVMFQPDQYETIKIGDLMHQPAAVLQADDPMEKVMDVFEFHQAWNLPVVREGKYLGFVSKSTIFGKYRALLQERSTTMT